MENFLKALIYYVKARNENRCLKALITRIRRIAYKILEFLGKYESILHEMLNFARNYQLIGYIHSELGIVYLNLGKLDESIKYFEQALKIFKFIKDYYMIGYTTCKLSILFMDKGENIDKAKELLEEAYKSLEYVTDPELKINLGFDVHSNATRVYAALGDYKKAYEEVLKEVEAAKSIDDPIYYAIALFHLTIVKRYLGMKEGLIEALKQSYEGFTLAGVKHFAKTAAMVLAEVYYDIGDYKSAIKYGSEALEYFKRMLKYPMYYEIAVFVALAKAHLGMIREAYDIINNAIEEAKKQNKDAFCHLLAALGIICSMENKNIEKCISVFRELCNECKGRGLDVKILNEALEALKKIGNNEAKDVMEKLRSLERN